MLCVNRVLRLLFAVTLMIVAKAASAQTVHIGSLNDLQNMNVNLAGSYVLDNDIDATASATLNGGNGFIPIGTASTPFTGSFDGQGHTITGLTINSTLQYVGLFGYFNPGGKAGFLQNVNLAQVTITSTATSAFVGALAGRAATGTNVLNCSATGSVQAANATYLGGLVGYIDEASQIKSSWTSISVNSTTPGGRIGGLAGFVNQQTILSNTQASGAVGGQSSGSGQAYIGGLVGQNAGGEIILSRATGSVTGTGNSIVGGLVGYGNESGTYTPPLGFGTQYYITYPYPSIEQSFATGAVSTGSNGYVGGLVGQQNPGDIDQSFATGNVADADGGGNEGGLVGYNGGGTITQSFAFGNVSGNSANALGGLVGLNTTNGGVYPVYGVITDTFSVGGVAGLYPKYAGGLIGYNPAATVATNSYWATDTSTQSSSAAGTGVTLASLESGLLPTGFSSTIWTSASGTLPSLISNPSPVQGYINPKYQVVGVTYAPPGPASGTFVQYTSGSSVGTSQSISQSFMSSNTLTATVSAGYGVDLFKGSVSLQYSQKASQTVKNTSSISTNFQVQQGEKTAGTGNYFYPIDHDYDIIWIWLNPTVILTVYPPGGAGASSSGAVDWNGYGFDTHDQSDVDVVGIPLGYLNGHFGAIPAEYQTSLARAWSSYQAYGPGDIPALTVADLAQIASADPFSVSSYGLNYITYSPPSPDTSDNRFTVSACTGESGIPYLQAVPSQSAETYSCSLTNTATSSKSNDITSSYSQTYSIDLSAQYGKIDFIKAEVKDEYTLTWTTEDQTSTSNGTTTSASLAVQGPPCNNVVAGVGPCVPVYDANGDQPTQFYVYQDNLYGTFMFAPVNYYTSNLTTTASTPIFTPPGGTYATKQTVTITDATPTTTIFYTTNGTTPTTSSTIYSSPITVATDEIFQAIAVAADLSNSPVGSATYSITNPQTAASPTFSFASGTYSSALTIAMTDVTPSSLIYYTTDGTAPTTNSTLYSVPIVVNTTETIKALAAASGYADSPVAVATYTINAPSAAASPTFSVAPGTYTTAQTVTITDSAPNSTIYYTTNGSVPTTNSPVYSSPVIVTTTETLEAMAVAPGYTQSAVVSASYAITTPTPTPTFQLSANPNALTIRAGQSGSANISIVPLNGFNSAITLACSGLSAGMGCTFNTASVTPSGGTATSTLTITTTAASASVLPARSGRSVLYCAIFLPSSFLLVLLGMPGRRKSLTKIFLSTIVLGTFALGISSCGSTGTNSASLGASTPIGTSAITVVGLTSGSNATSQTTSIAVTVK